MNNGMSSPIMQRCQEGTRKGKPSLITFLNSNLYRTTTGDTVKTRV